MFSKSNLKADTCRPRAVCTAEPNTLLERIKIVGVFKPEKSGQRLGKWADVQASVCGADINGDGEGEIEELEQDTFGGVEDIGAIYCQEIKASRLVGGREIRGRANFLCHGTILMHII